MVCYLEPRWIVRDWNLAAETRNSGEMNEEWKRGAEEGVERMELCNKKTCLHAAKGDMDKERGMEKKKGRKGKKKMAAENACVACVPLPHAIK